MAIYQPIQCGRFIRQLNLSHKINRWICLGSWRLMFLHMRRRISAVTEITAFESLRHTDCQSFTELLSGAYRDAPIGEGERC